MNSIIYDEFYDSATNCFRAGQFCTSRCGQMFSATKKLQSYLYMVSFAHSASTREPKLHRRTFSWKEQCAIFFILILHYWEKRVLCPEANLREQKLWTKARKTCAIIRKIFSSRDFPYTSLRWSAIPLVSTPRRCNGSCTQLQRASTGMKVIRCTFALYTI